MLMTIDSWFWEKSILVAEREGTELIYNWEIDCYYMDYGHPHPKEIMTEEDVKDWLSYYNITVDSLPPKVKPCEVCDRGYSYYKVIKGLRHCYWCDLGDYRIKEEKK